MDDILFQVSAVAANELRRGLAICRLHQSSNHHLPAAAADADNEGPGRRLRPFAMSLFFFWLTVVCMSGLEVWFLLRGPASRARIPNGGWWETEGGG